MITQPAPLSRRQTVDDARGFTIIELVLVIAILGILALAVVVFSPSTAVIPMRLDSASRQIQADIQYAQQNATLTGVTAGIQFVADGVYTVYQGTIATPLKNPLTKQDMVITLSDQYPDIAIQANYTVEFDSFGAPTTGGGGGDVTITNGTNTRTIVVAANTGRVTIQ